MSESILKALMQLFAIVADVEGITKNSREIVQSFLKQQLSQAQVEEYLKIYDEFLEAHHKISQKKEGRAKRTSVNSVKVLKICTQINSELEQKQKIVVLIRLLEYIYSGKTISEQEMEFVTTVGDTFNISKQEFDNCMSFVTCAQETIPDSPLFLVINNKQVEVPTFQRKHIYSDTLTDQLLIMSVESVGMYFIRYFGSSELYLNGLVLDNLRTYILTQGSSIRSTKVHPIYYSDIISTFLSDKSQSKVVFVAEKLEYFFKGGKVGLHPLTFFEESGKLVGIMGGSGAGKSTVLNVLNGNYPPSSGSVRINGVDIYKDQDVSEGVIGYVPQDDLLIEQLTVYQNLFYNAKLCFATLTDEEIDKLVVKVLSQLGLLETRHLKVGNVMMKTISGGQRKRLNIALELIREPAVMFVDEPTSGLSSQDSENVMDLLKELALKGKIIFVVIHQPSSEIFKMFDKLLILDVGGFPIYYGNPVDGVIYFKRLINHVKSEESECTECGNVNPEQIFNIIESKVVDEYGNATPLRKVAPKEWNEFYKEKLAVKNLPAKEDYVLPQSLSQIPNKLKQFIVFVTRDVLSKLTNTQYLSINLLEAPFLAFLLSFFIRFYDTDIKNELGYTFFINENIPVYVFMSVVVSLFIGMMVSAEEIIADQKIRKRESFLNLSNGSYLVSKIAIMFTISAIQMFTFIIIGNTVLGIKDMYFDYWLVLFTTACFANMVGLNVSATFNSAVTIYIIIPLLIIPQLLFAGVVVKFDKLNPLVTSQTVVPVIGDVMTSRWAFEAVLVNQYINNKYTKEFYPFQKEMQIARFKKNYWISNLKIKVSNVENYIGKTDKSEQLKNDLLLLKNEISKELTHTGKGIPFEDIDKLTPTAITPEILERVTAYLEKINKFYIKKDNASSDAQDRKIREKTQTPEAKAALDMLRNEHDNEQIFTFVTNKNDLKQMLEVDNQLIQRVDPIYLDPDGFRAHFYAPRKKLFGQFIPTYWVNIGVIWTFSMFLMITLYFDVFKKILDLPGKLFSKN